jgi:hypothetical protein
MALEELHESGLWVDRGVLSHSAVDWQCRALERLLGSDPALGTAVVRRELQQTLHTSLTVASEGRRRLRQLIDTARPGYLHRWADHLAQDKPLDPERAARAVAAHLLDGGHSLAGLQRWLQGDNLRLSAVDLVQEAAKLEADPQRRWRVMVPLRSIPEGSGMDGLPHWAPAEQARSNGGRKGHRGLRICNVPAAGNPRYDAHPRYGAGTSQIQADVRVSLTSTETRRNCARLTARLWWTTSS